MISFFKSLSDLYSLYKIIEQISLEVRESKKVSEDIEQIKKAFETKDASHLDYIFNRMPDEKAP